MNILALIFAAVITAEGTVALPPDPETGYFALAEDKGSPRCVLSARLPNPKCLKAGDRVVVECEERRDKAHVHWFVTKATILGAAELPEFHLASAADINHYNKANGSFARLRGHVRDAVIDDIDELWAFLTIDAADGAALAIAMIGPQAKARIRDLIGAEVELRGTISPQNPLISRRYFGPTFHFQSLQNLTVLKPRGKSLFDAPDIRLLRGLTPHEISGSSRHRVRGQVLAVWNTRKILVRAENGENITIELSSDAVPPVDAMIEVVGFPETDLYALNLSRGEWRPIAGLAVPPNEPVRRLSARELMLDVEGKSKIKARFYGAPITIRGVIRQISDDPSTKHRSYIEADHRLIAVHTDTLPALPSGFEQESTVEVTGICILETERWRENVIVPRVTDIFLVPRSEKDLTVLRKPPFWTPFRFFVTLVALIVVLVLILAWNATLRVLVTRKSRALLKEQVERSEALFRVDERTRLAVELHDSVAQDLTSVAMQVETAALLSADTSPKIQQTLRSATMMLQNCREELRICLWDLRNGSLDEKNMEDAIRRMLKPLLGDTKLHIRFNVIRSHVLDATAHTTLRIVRELVSNAIRHGKAKTIRIAGAIEGNHILFSVSDDGVGFDLKSVPGIPQGHFGLTGIRERVRKLNGKIVFSTALGQGTKASITL